MTVSSLVACPIAAPISPSPFLTHYCIVRRDLPPGLQAANLVHAAGESSPGFLPKGTYAIALWAKDERELRLLGSRLEDARINPFYIIESEGAHAGQLMAIGLAPCDRQLVRKLLSSYPLVKHAPCRCEVNM